MIHENKVIRSEQKRHSSDASSQMKRYQELNLDLSSEIEKLKKELRSERKRNEELEQLNDKKFRAIVAEREKQF